MFAAKIFLISCDFLIKSKSANERVKYTIALLSCILLGFFFSAASTFLSTLQTQKRFVKFMPRLFGAVAVSVTEITIL